MYGEEKLAGCLRSVYIDLSKAFILRVFFATAPYSTKKRTRVYFIPSTLSPSSALVVMQHFHSQDTFFTTKENKVLIRLAGDILFRIHNQLPLPRFLLTYSATCCKKCDFSAVTSAVFLPRFLFFFLSPASLSHFILFICKVSMTVNCLFKGGVEEAF